MGRWCCWEVLLGFFPQVGVPHWANFAPIFRNWINLSWFRNFYSIFIIRYSYLGNYSYFHETLNFQLSLPNVMPYRPFLKGRCCSGTMGGRQVFRSNLQVTLYLNCLFTWEAISWWSKHHILSFKIPFVSLMNEFNDHKIKMMNAMQIRILKKYQLHTFSSTWRGCWINSKKCLNKDKVTCFILF